MPKTYKNPPIIEAICEFRFELPGPHSGQQTAAFYDKIKGAFPNAKKGKIHSLEFKISPDEESGEEKKNYKKGFTEFEQYFSHDEKYSVQLDGGRVSIHRIKPYTSWTEFSPRIKLVYNSYVECFSPTNVSRAGLRYVNEMSFPTKDFVFDDFFNIKVSLPSLVEKSQQSIFIGSVFEQEGGKDAIRVQFAEKQGSTTDSIFVLDTDYFLVSTPLVLSDVENWIERAHANLEEVFEGIVSDKTKAIFDK